MARNKALLQRLSNVDIRLLRIFRTVADCGGFAASEFELNIGRSTISRHMSDLETRLGLKLCTRGPGGFALTREGTLVLEATNKLINALNTFQSEVNDIHQHLRGTLRFAFFDLAAGNPQANLPQALEMFAKNAPDVEIELSTETPNVIETGVINGRFDIGIIPLHRRSDGLKYYPLYPETMVLYCGKGHPLYEATHAPIDAEQLSQFKYAGFGFNSPNMLAGQKLNFTLGARVQNEEALKVLLLSGQFLGFLPEHVAKEHVTREQLRAVPVANTSYQISLGAVVQKRPEISRKTEVFLDCLNATHPQDV